MFFCGQKARNSFYKFRFPSKTPGISDKMAESDALKMAYRAEQDLNSYQAKQGLGPKSDSSMQCPCALSYWKRSLTVTAAESGVNEMVDKKFPQETGVKTGPGAVPTGSDRRPIPEDEGGVRDDRGR